MQDHRQTSISSGCIWIWDDPFNSTRQAGWKGSAAGSAAEMPKTSYYQAMQGFGELLSLRTFGFVFWVYELSGFRVWVLGWGSGVGGCLDKPSLPRVGVLQSAMSYHVPPKYYYIPIWVNLFCHGVLWCLMSFHTLSCFGLGLGGRAP